MPSVSGPNPMMRPLHSCPMVRGRWTQVKFGLPVEALLSDPQMPTNMGSINTSPFFNSGSVTDSTARLRVNDPSGFPGLMYSVPFNRSALMVSANGVSRYDSGRINGRAQGVFIANYGRSRFYRKAIWMARRCSILVRRRGPVNHQSALIFTNLFGVRLIEIRWWGDNVPADFLAAQGLVNSSTTKNSR